MKMKLTRFHHCPQPPYNTYAGPASASHTEPHAEGRSGHTGTLHPCPPAPPRLCPSLWSLPTPTLQPAKAESAAAPDSPRVGSHVSLQGPPSSPAEILSSTPEQQRVAAAPPPRPTLWGRREKVRGHPSWKDHTAARFC